jgi:uncharacterized protein YbjT (DUF2867 family)
MAEQVTWNEARSYDYVALAKAAVEAAIEQTHIRLPIARSPEEVARWGELPRLRRQQAADEILRMFSPMSRGERVAAFVNAILDDPQFGTVQHLARTAFLNRDETLFSAIDDAWRDQERSLRAILHWRQR